MLEYYIRRGLVRGHLAEVLQSCVAYGYYGLFGDCMSTTAVDWM